MNLNNIFSHPAEVIWEKKNPKKISRRLISHSSSRLLSRRVINKQQHHHTVEARRRRSESRREERGFPLFRFNPFALIFIPCASFSFPFKWASFSVDIVLLEIRQISSFRQIQIAAAADGVVVVVHGRKEEEFLI